MAVFADKIRELVAAEMTKNVDEIGRVFIESLVEKLDCLTLSVDDLSRLWNDVKLGYGIEGEREMKAKDEKMEKARKKAAKKIQESNGEHCEHQTVSKTKEIKVCGKPASEVIDGKNYCKSHKTSALSEHTCEYEFPENHKKSGQTCDKPIKMFNSNGELNKPCDFDDHEGMWYCTTHLNAIKKHIASKDVPTCSHVYGEKADHPGAQCTAKAKENGLCSKHSKAASAANGPKADKDKKDVKKKQSKKEKDEDVEEKGEDAGEEKPSKKGKGKEKEKSKAKSAKKEDSAPGEDEEEKDGEESEEEPEPKPKKSKKSSSVKKEIEKEKKESEKKEKSKSKKSEDEVETEAEDEVPPPLPVAKKSRKTVKNVSNDDDEEVDDY